LIFPKTKAGTGPGAECRIFLPAPMINGRKASAKKDPDAVFLRVKTVEKNGRVSFQPIGRREWTASGEKISIALES
jgi:hypothetical protein